MFGSIISQSEILQSGNTYVFTFHSGELFFIHSVDTIRQELSDRLSGIGTISNVSRGLFSDNYIVTVIPSQNFSLSYWIDAFMASWQDMGWSTILFVQAEGGSISTQPGGLQQVLPSVSGTIGSTVAESIKPLFPYILIGIGVYALIQVSPQFLYRN